MPPKANRRTTMDDYEPKNTCKHGPDYGVPRNLRIFGLAVHLPQLVVKVISETNPVKKLNQHVPELAKQLYKLERESLGTEPLVSEVSKQILFGSAVDAYLNHDFKNAFGMWVLYELIKSCLTAKEEYMPEKAPEVTGPIFASECFFQLTLLQRAWDGHGKLKTPWGTPYYYYKSESSPFHPETFVFWNRLVTEGSSEEFLLRELQRDIPCLCLAPEDPKSPFYKSDLGKADPNWEPGVGVRPPKKGKDTKCHNCGKQSAIGEPKYPVCGKCKLVRYCSKDCQKADWKEHKTVCGLQPDWWSKLPKK